MSGSIHWQERGEARASLKEMCGARYLHLRMAGTAEEQACLSSFSIFIIVPGVASWMAAAKFSRRHGLAEEHHWSRKNIDTYNQ